MTFCLRPFAVAKTSAPSELSQLESRVQTKADNDQEEGHISHGSWQMRLAFWARRGRCRGQDARDTFDGGQRRMNIEVNDERQMGFMIWWRM